VVVAELTRPRICSVPRFKSSRGQEAIELGRRAGLIADAHQEFVIDNALGVKEDGKWAAFEVGLCEPRQNGKGGILEVVELANLFLFGSKLVVHSAHEFRTSLEHFFRMKELIEESDLQRELKSKGGVRTSHGEEGFELKNGCRMHFRTRTKKGGRGFSGDFLGLDEAMIISEAMMGAMFPTLRARPNPQVWYSGSAVDQLIHEYGTVFSRVRARGIAGDTKDMAYFEWSVDMDDPEELTEEQSFDEELWAQSNPALGVRISLEHMRKERDALDLRTFAVELLGIGDWPRTDGQRLSPIHHEEWDALADFRSVLQDPIVLSFDVSPERRCSISTAGRNGDGLWHLELIANYPGTKQLTDRLLELAESHQPWSIVCDGYGPAASLVPFLVDKGLNIHTLNSGEHAAACGLMADAVTQKTLRHLGSPEVANAVRGAATRPLGDAWAWSRRNSTVDISPLVAMTLALHAAQDLPADDSGVMIW
jgi:hypothetical protein